MTRQKSERRSTKIRRRIARGELGELDVDMKTFHLTPRNSSQEPRQGTLFLMVVELDFYRVNGGYIRAEPDQRGRRSPRSLQRKKTCTYRTKEEGPNCTRSPPGRKPTAGGPERCAAQLDVPELDMVPKVEHPEVPQPRGFPTKLNQQGKTQLFHVRVQGQQQQRDVTTCAARRVLVDKQLLVRHTNNSMNVFRDRREALDLEVPKGAMSPPSPEADLRTTGKHSFKKPLASMTNAAREGLTDPPDTFVLARSGTLATPDVASVR